jgi:hypothetical protein
MRGDNIIEAYCALCGRPITAADVNLGYRIYMEDKPVHLHHDHQVIKGLENPDIAVAVAEVIEYVFFSDRDKDSPLAAKQIYQFIVDKALPLGIQWEELKKCVDGLLCRTKYANKKEGSNVNS